MTLDVAADLSEFRFGGEGRHLRRAAAGRHGRGRTHAGSDQAEEAMAERGGVRPRQPGRPRPEALQHRTEQPGLGRRRGQREAVHGIRPARGRETADAA